MIFRLHLNLVDVLLVIKGLIGKIPGSRRQVKDNADHVILVGADADLFDVIPLGLNREVLPSGETGVRKINDNAGAIALQDHDLGNILAAQEHMDILGDTGGVRPEKADIFDLRLLGVRRAYQEHRGYGQQASER